MEPILGEIKLFGGDFAPRGWALCDGRLLDIHQYHSLFTLLQTYYGGNGETTFALPDLRGRAPIQQGQGKTGSGYALGQQAGAETVSLTPAQLPAHSHTVNTIMVGNQPQPDGNFLGALPVDIQSGVGVNNYASGTPDSKLNAATITGGGNNQPVSIISPVLALNYIIALEGIYPSRS